MLKRWVHYWNETPLKGRVPLLVAALLCVLLCGYGVAYNVRIHSYADVLAEPVLLVFLLLLFVVWPFWVATAVRRRGGSFTLWVYLAIIFSGILIAVLYLLRWRHKPILEAGTQ